MTGAGLVDPLLLHQGGLAGSRRCDCASAACAPIIAPDNGKIAEGYPVNLKPGQRLPNAFAWTGTRSLFADAGFKLAGPPTTSKLRMRRKP